ncbi:MAG TPA: flagellar biosynthesis repressor FlbT [Alphaproteobacteria bacterium]
MALKLTLKPNEKIIVNGAVLTNGPAKTTFSIENTAVILRQKDILTEENANTPAKRIYFCLQMAYLDREHERDYLEKANHLVRDFVAAVPTEEVRGILEPVGVDVSKRNYFPALRQLRKLIAFEDKRLTYGR